MVYEGEECVVQKTVKSPRVGTMIKRLSEVRIQGQMMEEKES